MKRNIPGRCGNALAGNHNPGWGDVGRDASDLGGAGAAGRVEGRGAELAGDRAAARPGGVDDQPRTTSECAAQGRLPAGPRRGLLPRAPAATGRPRARRQARPLRPRTAAGGLDAGADRRLAQAWRGARAARRRRRDDLRLPPPPGAEGREALEAAAARARQAGPATSPPAARHHRGAALHPRPARGGAGARGGRPLGGRPADLQADPAGAGAQGARDPVRARGPAGRQVRGRDRGRHDGGVPAARPAAARVRHLRQRHRRWVLSRSATPQPLERLARGRREWRKPTASSTSTSGAPSSA
jgi:hypothetical protein